MDASSRVRQMLDDEVHITVVVRHAGYVQHGL